MSILNFMNHMKLSDQCLEKLSWYVDVDLDDDDMSCLFVVMASFCVDRARLLTKATSNQGMKSRYRINKVKKAFDSLTEEDKDFLELQFVLYDLYIDSSPEDRSDKDDMRYFIDSVISNYLDDDNNKATPCRKIQWALSQEVPSEEASASRKILLDFACVAVREMWVDVSVNNGNLTKVIKILMEEAGVKHDAVAIAKKAVALVQKSKF